MVLVKSATPWLTVDADTYTKVPVDESDHVTVGNTLNGTDIPEHSADLITSGHLPVNETLDLRATSTATPLPLLITASLAVISGITPPA